MVDDYKTIVENNTRATERLTDVIVGLGEKVDFQTEKFLEIVTDRSVVPLRMYLISMMAIIVALAGSKVLEKAITHVVPLVKTASEEVSHALSSVGIESTFAKDRK